MEETVSLTNILGPSTREKTCFLLDPNEFDIDGSKHDLIEVFGFASPLLVILVFLFHLLSSLVPSDGSLI